MRLPHIIQMAPKCNDECPFKKETEEGNMTIEEQTRLMWPQAKKTPRATRSWKKYSTEPPLDSSNRAGLGWHHGFRTLASRTVRQWISMVLSLLVGGNLLQQPRKLVTE